MNIQVLAVYFVTIRFLFHLPSSSVCTGKLRHPETELPTPSRSIPFDLVGGKSVVGAAQDDRVLGTHAKGAGHLPLKA